MNSEGQEDIGFAWAKLGHISLQQTNSEGQEDIGFAWTKLGHIFLRTNCEGQEDIGFGWITGTYLIGDEQ